MPMSRRHTAEWFVGTSLALVLQTNYRLFGGVGLGEIGLASFVLLAPLLREPASATNGEAREKFSRIFPFYIVVCLLPSTILTAVGAWGTTIDPSVAWRDYFAYVLSGLLVWIMGSRRFDIGSCARAFTVCTLAITLFQYSFGGPEAWYGTRFTGGAKNPNQLALYCVCCMATTAAHIRLPTHRLLLMAGFALMGSACRSDAFMLAMMAITAVFAMALLLPPRYLWIGVITAGTLMLYFVAFSSVLSLELGDRWSEADQGGTRLSLLLNGLSAWRHCWWSFFFGNGCGAFSGKVMPFEGDEAHNTLVDILAIGGIAGVVTVFWYPFQTAWNAYDRGRPLLFATMVGVLAFSCFHYVGRHPVFWFTVLAVGAAARQSSSTTINLIRTRLTRAPLFPVHRRVRAC